MPRNVPDLPRREQRRGNNQVMIWGAGLALILFAGVLAWAFVTVPNGQLGSNAKCCCDVPRRMFQSKTAAPLLLSIPAQTL